MKVRAEHSTSDWQRLESAAFGIIYGSITVLSILVVAGSHPKVPPEIAAILFGLVLAVTLAKAFAELMAHAIETRELITRHARRAAWRHSSATLAAANLPTSLFLAAAVRWLRLELAVLLSLRAHPKELIRRLQIITQWQGSGSNASVYSCKTRGTEKQRRPGTSSIR